MKSLLHVAITYFLPGVSAGSWTQLPDAGWSPRSGFQMVLSGNDVIVAGGTSDPSQSYNDAYRLKDGLWYPLPFSKSQWSVRSDFAAVVLENGTLVLSGGQNEDGGTASLNDVWALDAGSDTFRRLPDAPWSHRVAHSMAACPNDRVVLTGGGNTRAGIFIKQYSDVWAMDSTGAWSQLSDAPWHQRWMHRSVCFSDGTLLLAGGHSGFQRFHDVWSMDASGKWTELSQAAPWSQRANFGMARIGNMVVIGPEDDDSHLDVWAMDMSDKEWHSLGKAPFKPRQGYGMVASPNHTKAVLIAGGTILDNGIHNYNDMWQLTIEDNATVVV